MRSGTHEYSGWSGHGRPPLVHCGELPGRAGEDAGSGARGVSKPYAVSQVVPQRGRRNSCSHAATAAIGKSSLSTWAQRNVGYGRAGAEVELCLWELEGGADGVCGWAAEPDRPRRRAGDDDQAGTGEDRDDRGDEGQREVCGRGRGCRDSGEGDRYG